MVKKSVMIVILCSILVLVSGCWNNRPVEEMTFATAIGFDKEKDGQVEVTIQLVKPSALSGDGGSDKEAVWVYSNSGETVFEALRGMLNTVSRKIFMGQINLVVIQDQVAESGIMDIIDFLARDHEVNRKAEVVIAKEIKAKKVLAAKSELEDIPAVHIVDALQNNSAYAKVRDIKLFDLLTCLSASGFSPTVGVIQSTTELREEVEIKDLEMQGIAVFKKDKLVGWLEPAATRGLLFVLGEIESGIINITNPVEKDEKVSFEIVNSQIEKELELKAGEPNFSIKVTAEGRLGEQHGKGNLVTPKMVEKLEPRVEAVIKNDIKQAVNLAQKEFQSDIFGFSQLVYRQQIEYWQDNYQDWNQIFSQVPVEIKVVWETRSSGVSGSRIKVR